MKTFDFYLDTKVTTWMRTPFEIEAKNLEEAKKKAIKFHQQGNTRNIGWEEVMDIQEPMSVGDNGGEPTEELFVSYDLPPIWNNIEV
jgi:hypothetical protein